MKIAKKLFKLYLTFCLMFIGTSVILTSCSQAEPDRTEEFKTKLSIFKEKVMDANEFGTRERRQEINTLYEELSRYNVSSELKLELVNIMYTHVIYEYVYAIAGTTMPPIIGPDVEYISLKFQKDTTSYNLTPEGKTDYFNTITDTDYYWIMHGPTNVNGLYTRTKYKEEKHSNADQSYTRYDYQHEAGEGSITKFIDIPSMLENFNPNKLRVGVIDNSKNNPYSYLYDEYFIEMEGDAINLDGGESYENEFDTYYLIFRVRLQEKHYSSQDSNSVYPVISSFELTERFSSSGEERKQISYHFNALDNEKDLSETYESFLRRWKDIKDIFGNEK